MGINGFFPYIRYEINRSLNVPWMIFISGSEQQAPLNGKYSIIVESPQRDAAKNIPLWRLEEKEIMPMPKHHPFGKPGNFIGSRKSYDRNGFRSYAKIPQYVDPFPLYEEDAPYALPIQR